MSTVRLGRNRWFDVGEEVGRALQLLLWSGEEESSGSFEESAVRWCGQRAVSGFELQGDSAAVEEAASWSWSLLAPGSFSGNLRRRFSQREC